MRDLKHLLLFLFAVSFVLTNLPENDAKFLIEHFIKIAKALPPDLYFKLLLTTSTNSKKKQRSDT
ncbi:hypothetical protein [Flavobacterium sp.]|uniref:hypothetical protein n=1 Tax=Flavobacterium sp. TaxID=239 RepID=UPI00403456F3